MKWQNPPAAQRCSKLRRPKTFAARRSLREQFERFFVPAFTVLLFLLEFVAAYLSWRWLRTVVLTPINQPFVGMGLIGLFALILFVLGKYSAGLARLANQRLLRPSASYLLLGFFVCVLVVGAIASSKGGFRAVDLYLARAFVIALGLFSVESLISLVLEIYRPRVKGKTGAPLYESRVIGLLASPKVCLARPLMPWTTNSASKCRIPGFINFCGGLSFGCCSRKSGYCFFRPVSSLSMPASRRCSKGLAGR